jgi:hypothetical protein
MEKCSFDFCCFLHSSLCMKAAQRCAARPHAFPKVPAGDKGFLPVGGTNKRHFAGINLKPDKLLSQKKQKSYS